MDGSGPPPPPPPPPPPGGGWSARLTVPWVVALGLLAAALVGGAAYLGWLAQTNHERAERWRDRSETVQELAAERSRALNRQTARLNAASTRLREARGAIAASEQDVDELEARQRELADEKAQVEDQRASLLGLAGQLAGCNAGLGDLIETLGLGLPADSGEVDAVAAACSAADEALGLYLQQGGAAP